MPRDDGNLIVQPRDYAAVASDPIASRFVRVFVGSDELINNKRRWCLWLTSASEDEIRHSKVLTARTQAVREFRLKSTASSTRQMAETPHLFGQRPALYTEPYVVIPRVCSENRPYFTVGHVGPDVIASDATFTAADPDGYLFAAISSSMFMTWQRTVGGRLKSDLRFSSTIVWNNLPLPAAIGAELREEIIEAGQGVGAARDRYPQRSLAEHYDPAAMDSELVSAHKRLDEVVDQAFGARRLCSSDRERQQILFARYQELAAQFS